MIIGSKTRQPYVKLWKRNMGAIAAVVPASSTKCSQLVRNILTKVMATVMTAITTLVVLTMAVTVVRRALAVLFKRNTALNASVLIRIL